MGPVIAKVRSLQDQTLRTPFGVYNLVKGEVFEGKFKSERNLQDLIEIGIIIELATNSEIKKEIPVIFPSISIPEIKLTEKEIVEPIPALPVQLTLLNNEGQELPLSFGIDKFMRNV